MLETGGTRKFHLTMETHCGFHSPRLVHRTGHLVAVGPNLERVVRRPNLPIAYLLLMPPSSVCHSESTARNWVT
jgi:hypothetical protein